MERNGLAAVKLGGSVITEKDKTRVANLRVIGEIAKVISSSHRSFVVVHGGGSFGHTEAKKHGLTRQASKVPPEGVSATREAMLELNLLITRSLESHSIHPYSLPPSAVIRGEKVLPSTKSFLTDLLSKGLTPVTFGDVLPSEEGFFVLSGDIIVREFCRSLHPSLAVILMGVDGLYRDVNDRNSLIEELDPLHPPRIKFGEVSDATGGMKLKFEAALSMARMGTKVILVNGHFPERLAKVLKGERTIGTVIRRGGSERQSRTDHEEEGRRYQDPLGEGS